MDIYFFYVGVYGAQLLFKCSKRVCVCVYMWGCYVCPRLSCDILLASLSLLQRLQEVPHIS